MENNVIVFLNLSLRLTILQTPQKLKEMEDFRNYVWLESSTTLESTIAENAILKKNNDILVAVTILVGVVAIGLTVYYIDQEIKKKYSY